MIPHALFLTASILGVAWLTQEAPKPLAPLPITISSLPAPDTAEPSRR